MRKQLIAQRDMSAGELLPEAMRADDTEIFAAGLRAARNTRILNTRSLRRRPGSDLRFLSSGITEDIRPSDGEYWSMTIEAGAITFRNASDSIHASFTGQPWSDAILTDLSWVLDGGLLTIAHHTFHWREFTFDNATRTWADSGEGAFLTDQNGAYRMPFYGFNARSNITLQPVARSGATIVYASANIFVAEMAGLVFRYGERQFRIDVVINPQQAEVTCLEEMPPSFLVSVDNTTGFQEGDVIEGIDSGCVAIITYVEPTNTTHFRCLVQKQWEGFFFPISGTREGEYIVTPRSKSRITVQTAIDPEPTQLWDEQFMSSYRGWPGSVSSDSQRRIFAGFRQLGRAIVWSAIGSPNDFAIGADATDAIMEFVPQNCFVSHVIGGADEFIFTDVGVWYIPISASNPLQPGSVDMRFISSDAAAAIKPATVTEGLIYINQARSRVLAIVGTGQTARPYIVDDISEYHSHLFNSPVALAVTSSDANAPERYLYVVNMDGTVAVCYYKQRAPWAGWVPWEFAGSARWVTSAGPFVSMVLEAPSGQRAVVRMNEDRLLDACISGSASGDVLTLDSGAPLTLSDGLPLTLDASVSVPWVIGNEIGVESPQWYRGAVAVDGSGVLSGEIPAHENEIVRFGYSFAVTIAPFIAHAQAGQSVGQRTRRRKVSRALVTVKSSQAMTVANRLIPYYNAGENQEAAPPQRTQTYSARPAGRSFDPEWSVEQSSGIPGTLTVLELTTEVTI